MKTFLRNEANLARNYKGTLDLFIEIEPKNDSKARLGSEAAQRYHENP